MIITTLEERTKSFLDKMAVMRPEIEVLGTYVNNSTPISFKCNIDNNVWKTRPDYLISGCAVQSAVNVLYLKVRQIQKNIL